MKRIRIGVAGALLTLVAVCPAAGQPVSAVFEDPVIALRIIAAGGEPFVVTSPDGSISGLSIDVWSAAARELGIGGEITTASNVDEALDRLAGGDADLVIGPVSITEDRARRLRFTQPYFSAVLGIAARPGGTLLDRFAPFLTATFLTGAAGLVGILLIVGTLLWFAERNQNPEHFPSSSSGVGNGIWMALVTMTTVGYGDRVPRTFAGRVITGVWMLVSLVIASSLTAFLATALTLSQMDAVTTDFEERLEDGVVGVVAGTTSETFVRDRGGRVVAYDTLGDAFEAAATGNADAIVFDRPMLQYLLIQNPEIDLEVAPSGYQPQSYGFAAADAELAHTISLAILSMRETGELGMIVEKWLGSID